MILNTTYSVVKLARAYLLPLMRFGDARVRDDLSGVNFARGEVRHLVAFGKASLTGGITKKGV